MRWANRIQLTADELKAIQAVIRSYSKSRYLVFGVGYDSPFWQELNSEGTTVFLEDNAQWLATVQARVPELQIEKVQYHTSRELWRTYLDDPQLLALSLPNGLDDQAWDVILVDAPAGHQDGNPGRMQSIYTASKLAGQAGRCDVFVHDCDREIELFCADRFLGRDRFVRQTGLLRHYSFQPNQPCR